MLWCSSFSTSWSVTSLFLCFFSRYIPLSMTALSQEKKWKALFIFCVSIAMFHRTITPLILFLAHHHHWVEVMSCCRSQKSEPCDWFLVIEMLASFSLFFPWFPSWWFLLTVNLKVCVSWISCKFLSSYILFRVYNLLLEYLLCGQRLISCFLHTLQSEVLCPGESYW